MLFDGLYAGFSLTHWTALLAISGIGGFMRGFAGFGTTIVMVPLFRLLVSQMEAVLIGLFIDGRVVVPLFPDAIR